MKLDVNVLRYLTKEEFRTLTAVEMGQKNHEIVPAELVERIAGLRGGGAYKNMKTLLKHKLVHHDSSKYDGFRLTNLGYDYLAIKTLCNRGLITAIGRQIGVGKESDIFEAVGEDGEVMVLKLHRLGRTSFRAVKLKRDYLHHRSSFSWLYLSRLAALKEYAFMKALGEHGLPVPKAVDCNRHCVLMGLVPGYPLHLTNMLQASRHNPRGYLWANSCFVQVKELQHPAAAFQTIIGLIVRLAGLGLIHCDFNEFNLMIDEDENITMIDFPQMVSVSHKNAHMYFDRDVECVFKFFGKRFNYSPPVGWMYNDSGDIRQHMSETTHPKESSRSETGAEAPSSEDLSGQEMSLNMLGGQCGGPAVAGTEAEASGSDRDAAEAAEEPAPTTTEEEDSQEWGGGRPSFEAIVEGSRGWLDQELAASGFTRQNQRILERYAEEASPTASEESDTESEEAEGCEAVGEVENLQASTGSKGTDGQADGSSLQMLEEGIRYAGLDEAAQEQPGKMRADEACSATAYGGSEEDGSRLKIDDERVLAHKLERQRRQAAGAVRGRGGEMRRSSRNATKDRGGSRSKQSAKALAQY
eukprot:SM000010S04394  [mRNA]  locus=s10:1272384:1276888:- [translate_table: standard]